jgi:hypothetical protein
MLIALEILANGQEYIYAPTKPCLHQSAASSSSELDHQTCRGSSIGRACGSYLIRYSQPQGRGFEPLLRLFLHTGCWLSFALSRTAGKSIWDGGGEKIFFFWCVKPGLADRVGVGLGICGTYVFQTVTCEVFFR